ncbi:uncharacterized protein BKA78DRAFT_308924 [Phyllosticta capitalensis]|uniref:uncharacterized protein n=1 Tax=Phyllosticta capitalensis TaxID=121624 RepID=UPI00312E265C
MLFILCFGGYCLQQHPIGCSSFLSLQELSNDWPRGPMARRLTTNQEIPGSTPGVVISFCFGSVWGCDASLSRL